MSVEPPNSGRPTGPPSGPLSGRAQPPSGPPPAPPARAPDDEPREPGRPWWKSVPRVATVAVVVAALATVGVLLTRGDGGTGGSREIFLQAANSQGPDPFTESTAQGTSTASATPTTPTTLLTPSETVTAGENTVRGYNGGTPGVYGGTLDVAACDVELQITYLQENPEKNAAFAAVFKLDPADVPAYLRGLTPVLLRMDTRVTNHGYRDGEADPYQAILQSGTAVLVNDRGLPRVRCACGNPLTNPLQQHTGYERIGDFWPSFDPAKVIVVLPAAEPVKTFVLRDTENGGWVARLRGDDGDRDEPTKPPKVPPTPTEISPRPPSPGTGSPPSDKPASPDSPDKDSPDKDSPDKDSPDKDSPDKDSPDKDSPDKDSPRPDSSPTPPPPSPPTDPDTPRPEPPQSPPTSSSVPFAPDSITPSAPTTSLPVPVTSVPSV